MVLLSDVLRYIWGRFDKMVGVIDCKSSLEFVVFWPKTLIGGVELSVVVLFFLAERDQWG